MTALEQSLRNGEHLRARDAVAVAAARSMVTRTDGWYVIVDWALEDTGGQGRSDVPVNENVSIATFVEHIGMLGVAPSAEVAQSSPRAKAPMTSSSLDAWGEAVGWASEMGPQWVTPLGGLNLVFEPSRFVS